MARRGAEAGGGARAVLGVAGVCVQWSRRELGYRTPKSRTWAVQARLLLGRKDTGGVPIERWWTPVV